MALRKKEIDLIVLEKYFRFHPFSETFNLPKPSAVASCSSDITQTGDDVFQGSKTWSHVTKAQNSITNKQTTGIISRMTIHCRQQNVQELNVLPQNLLDGSLQQWRPLQGLVRISAGLRPRRSHLLPHPLLHLRVPAELEQSKLQGHSGLGWGW